MERFHSASAVSVSTLNPGYSERTIVLLEDSQDQISSVRRIVGSLRFQLLAAADWETAVALAEGGAQFFILDIKLGDDPDRVKAGLKALEVLRQRHQNTIFIAVLSALKQQHEAAINKLRADISCEKSDSRQADIELILAEWARWRQDGSAFRADETSAAISGASTGNEDDDPAVLFPSDLLALKIAGATDHELAKILRDRKRLAEAVGEAPPRFDDLVEEIGARMREELRGVLRELADRVIGKGNAIILAEEDRLAGDLVRFIFRVLPITYGGDEVLDELKNELWRAARQGLDGEWGTVKVENNQVVLSV
jgi:CheY-like chemotaxis protein